MMKKMDTNDNRAPAGKISPPKQNDDFWIAFGKDLITKSIYTIDERAKFMITTAATLLAIDYAVLVFANKIAFVTVSPQFFFALSGLFFIISLFPRKYSVNPSTPDETKATYTQILDHKYNFNLIGFIFFFVALVSVALSSFSIVW